MPISDQQLKQINKTLKNLSAQIDQWLGPGGSDPATTKQEAVAYVKANFAVAANEFSMAAGADFASAALVERNDNVSPSQGSPVYDGIPVGVAYFDAATTDDTTINPRAFKGINDLPALRKAIQQHDDSKAEVWIWKRDGRAYQAKTGKLIEEGVIVSGQGGVVQLPG